MTATLKRLKYVATINDDALGEDTDADFEMQYVDIGNVDSTGTIGDLATYRFEDAPSRARRRVRDGDVIISTVRTYLQAIAPIQQPPANLIVSTGFAVVRPVPGVFDAHYCKYALREPEFLAEVERRSVGVSYPAINASDLASIPVHLHTPAKQRAIAHFLDRETARIDALIAAKQRLVGQLAEKRRALMTRTVTRGLDPSVRLSDSGLPWLGDIPAHWKVKRLRHISPAITVGVVVNPSTYVTDEGVPFLYGSDITEDGIRPDGARRLPAEVSRGELAKTCLKAGDVLTVRVGAPGVTAVVPPELEGANCASVMLVRRSPTFESALLAYMMNSPIGRYQVALVQYGAAQEQFNISHAVDFWFPVPPAEEQLAIVEYLGHQIDKLDGVRSATESTISLLRERRGALIAAAVNGQVDVGAAA